MTELLQKAKILICVGSGGVGKTSVAAALAVLAAEMNRRVLVLTIDPSQRLKTTLKLKEDGSICRIKENLHAAVVNSQKTFDDFVLKAASYSENAKRILKNKLYIQLSTNLNGSQEFTALEKLFENYESKQFDLIILDTPPTKHAIDFLNAPQKLAVMFNEGVAKWFRTSTDEKRSFFSHIVYASTLRVLKALEFLTGSEFMGQLTDFFQNIESWQGKIESRIVAVQHLLVDKDTHFCLVSSLDRAKILEAEYFAREIKKGGYQLSAMIINRAFPSWFQNRQKVHPKLADLKKSMETYYESKMTLTNTIMNTSCTLPEMDTDISSLQEVEKLARLIKR